MSYTVLIFLKYSSCLSLLIAQYFTSNALDEMSNKNLARSFHDLPTSSSTSPQGDKVALHINNINCDLKISGIIIDDHPRNISDDQ